MCRLLGYVARRPTSVVDAIGAEEFEAFTELTAVHGDGWGMAWQDPRDHTIRGVASPHSAIHDPGYARRARQPLGRAGLVHLRWATPGLPVAPQNTHPFVEGGYAFAHNGHISPVEQLEKLLAPQARAGLRGDTDSERYFRFVRQCIAERGDDAEGLTRALGVLTAEFPRASLNALMLTPDQLFGVHVNSRAAAPLRGLRELFASDDDFPDRHGDDYFTMDYRLAPDAVHVVSSGIDPEGWTPLPEDTVVVVDLASLEVRRLDGWREGAAPAPDPPAGD